jgi:hypothetical protein
MSKSNPKNPVTIEQRYLTLLVLWIGLSTALVVYLAFIQFFPVAPAPNQKLTLMLNFAGIVPVAASFLIKQSLIAKAIANQRLEQIHTAYIVSWALCEVAGLLALMDNRSTGSSYYYIGFALAGLGMLLHFPQKKHLLAASGREF